MIKKSKKQRRRLWGLGFFKAQLLSQRHGKMRRVTSKHGKMYSSSSLILKEGKMPMRRDTTIYDIPEQILPEILKRLPVKYILRCRCVQKSWYYLLQTSMFVTLHLNYVTHHHHHPKYLLFRNTFSDKLTIRSDDIQCEQLYCTIKSIPALPRFTIWFKLSYGLICMSSMFDVILPHLPYQNNNNFSNIYLWNPLVQKYKILPDSPLPIFNYRDRWWGTLAFGFIPQVSDYVVLNIVKPRLRCVPDPHSVLIGVYSLNTNSWKKITLDNVFIHCISKHDVFVNGVAFWIGVNLNNHRIVMCFDTKTDTLREISLPPSLPLWVDQPRKLSSCPSLHPFGQSITYFVKDNELNHFDMWVLNGDPMNEFSWEKKMSVSLSEDFCLDVLGLRNNGEPIFFKLFDFISYNLDNHEAINFVQSWDRWDDFSEEDFKWPYIIRPFVESLVLLNTDQIN